MSTSQKTYRGGRGGSWQPRGGKVWQKKPVQESTTPPPPLGPLIKKMRPADFADAAAKLEKSAIITDSALVASFNWLNSKKPVIIVPGGPPRWTPLAVPRELPDDNGVIQSDLSSRRRGGTPRQAPRDGNAARFPKHPMEPAIRAALAVEPSLCQQRQFDIIACGSTLGNLLRVIRGEDKFWRMLVEVVGDTVFLIRRENSPTETIQDIQGYGHSFPEHYTTWDAEVKGSLSHQRLLRYRFGGMRFMVRFEGDGFIDNSAKAAEKPRPSHSTSMGLVESLVKDMDVASIFPEETATGGELVIKTGGRLVQQDLVFDIKTRSIKKIGEDILSQEMPRLWIAQISKFVLAFHDRGTFKDVRVTEVGDKIKEWELANRATLSKLAALVQKIGDMARERSDGKLELCHSELGVLEVREQLPDAGDALSSEVKELWCQGAESEDTDNGGVDCDKRDDDEFVWRDWQKDMDGEGEDFTACSDHCGYCGRCTH